MEKLNRDFLEQEILFYGCSLRDLRFCKMAYKTLTKNGFKLYPVGSIQNKSLGFHVYDDLNKLPKGLSFAHIVSDKEETRKVVQRLHELGIRKILFNSRNCVDADILARCEKMGIKTLVACPMMIYGSGPCKLHAFFAGVKR